MEVTPELHFLDSKDADNVGWHDALAELIDNALDAGAMRVEVQLAGRKLSIRDDGIGVENIASLVKFGSHQRHKTTSLGRYGVGLKDAWCYFGKRMVVETVRAGTLTTLDIDRSQIKVMDGKWIAPDPESQATTLPGGTTVTFEPLRKDRTRPDPAALAKLGWTFMPAIERGRQIVYSLKAGCRKAIGACQLPPLQERIEVKLDVAGKPAELVAGIMQEGARNLYPSLWLSYGHRNISYSSMGCGNYSSSRIAGIVRLGHGWRLTPHKNDIADLGDELDKAIFRHLEPMLQRASKLIEDINSSKLRTKLEQTINSALAGAKAKETRGPRNRTTGTVKDKDTGRTRKHAERFDVSRPGSVELLVDAAIRRRGVKLDWCTIEPERIGRYDALGNVVLLNTDNQFVAKCKAKDNVEALHAVAIGLLCHHACNHDRTGKQPLLLEKRDFIAGWGLVMASLKFEEKCRGK